MHLMQTIAVGFGITFLAEDLHALNLPLTLVARVLFCLATLVLNLVD